jgi:hypothetical protein
VLDRVDVDVIDVTGEVALIANGMFPVTALPDAALAFGGRLPEMRSPAGRLRENADLISRQRTAKSASPCGSVQAACR